MKMILIAYNEAVDEEVMEVLEGAGVHGYSKWTQVLGRGGASGPHLSTPVWPKANNVLMLGVTEEQAKKVMDGVRGLRRTLSAEGVKAFAWNVEDAT